MTRRALPLVLVLAAFVLALSACGGGSSSSSTTPATTGGGGGGGGSTVKISADPSGALKYEQTDVSATAGSITIDFTNMSSLPHDVTIEGNGASGATDEITNSSTSTTVDLEPGTYTFFCSVDGHRAAGMEGTLTVK
ncbi:MAG TPA: plastocyanin/azurin family copper-binding protein [Gaiellaceae bacterium]|nr:plastocyanin/azurin family copper-binding protein [Gaiellaceae bacterium]